MSHNPQCNGDEIVNGEVTSTFEKIKNVIDTPSDPLCISKISICNFLKNIENMTNVRVIASDEIQFNAENKENDKDAKRLTSKRKMFQPLTNSKRFCSPRYIRDL